MLGTFFSSLFLVQFYHGTKINNIISLTIRKSQSDVLSSFTNKVRSLTNTTRNTGVFPWKPKPATSRLVHQTMSAAIETGVQVHLLANTGSDNPNHLFRSTELENREEKFSA